MRFGVSESIRQWTLVSSCVRSSLGDRVNPNERLGSILLVSAPSARVRVAFIIQFARSPADPEAELS